MISNPQERLRWNAFGGTPTVERLRWNAYGGTPMALVSADLQSAASYLFRICNPLQGTAQERKSTHKMAK